MLCTDQARGDNLYEKRNQGLSNARTEVNSKLQTRYRKNMQVSSQSPYFQNFRI
ncbi:hypothetical protein RIR_e40368_A0A2I1F5L5_9GLOM [Rhizophagus irregularis DAOM 181602=DAOM 197198]|nr:hypothetical protein RIR_e40368_A0A2I1F5L5_9GLOM [Rhizophagus irregularis DAOM 181602=DAOM 197198]